MKKIILIIAVALLMFGSYRIGTNVGAEASAAEIVGRLRQNCNEGTHFTSLDKVWALRCQKI